MAETQDILYHSKGISKKYNRQVLLAMVPTIVALIIIVPVGLGFSTSQRYSGGLVISGSGAGIVLLLAALCIGMIDYIRRGRRSRLFGFRLSGWGTLFCICSSLLSVFESSQPIILKPYPEIFSKTSSPTVKNLIVGELFL